MEELLGYYNLLVNRTKTDFHRYLYTEIDWQDHLVGLTGPRGVGKTTLILQHIKENLNRNTTLYVTAEDLYFSNHTLLSLAKSKANSRVMV